ncbi:Cell division protein FtsX [compost metagenome]
MRGPKKSLALHISTLIVVTACFVVMGGALLLSQNLQKILTLWGEDIQMTVYLSEDITDESRKSIESFLKATNQVGDIRLVTQEKALGDFRQQLATYAPDLAQDDELLKLIPSSLQVSLASSVSTQDQTQVLKSLAEKVHDLDGVDEVSYGQDWVEKYSALVTAIEISIRGLGFIIVLASIFVMSNVIRASVEARREEIAVLELIGATSTMIRRPFLVDGAFLGGISSLAALGICFGIFVAAKELFLQKLSFLQLGHHLIFLSITLSIFFVIGGIALGAFGSYLCVRRINDGWAARAG